tara:strand:+ start:632 stop:847 length:216 start_codon:yes stop_codon:yes gene_type:complete
MWFVITIMLSFNHIDDTLLKEYTKKTFTDTWECHEFISENKMILLSPHIIKHGKKLKGFEFYCESRQGEEV